MVAIKGLTIDFLDDEPTVEKAGYIFYSGFKYGVNKNVQKRIKVNQFFFVRISRHDDPCIGELVSIWKDKFRDTMLSSVRLYFLPEQTPDGRQSNHGQHEVLAASEPVILRLNDLVSWITDEVDWVTGLEVPYSSNKIDPPAFTLPFLNLINKQITLGYHNCNPHNSSNHEIDNDVKINQQVQLQQSNEEPENQSTIVVLSYPQYCRYRAVLKKMEENFKEKENVSVNCKVTKSTLTLPTPTSPKHEQTLSTSAIVEPDKCKIYPNIRILFCRETFEHEGLLHHDLNCEHLAPKLKGRPRKRGGSSVTMNVSAAKTSSHSSSSQDSDTSEENSKQDSSRVRLPRKTSATTNKVKSHEVDCAFQGNRNNVTSKYKSTTSPMSAKLAEKCLKSETEFMKQLNKFMKERNTPITRIPHLGFKKIDLFYLFTLTQKLGGYERITKQRTWKIVYDRLGGDPRSTSAATCTRRHFERLLLPFERHLNEARGIKTNRRSTRGRSISPLGSPELSTKGGEGLDDDQSIASATSMVTEERKGRRGHHRHRHRRQGVRQSKRLQQGSSSAPATVVAASTNGSTSSATDDDESESLNSELHEEEVSKSSIVDGCPVEGELVKSEESQSGQSERKIDKSSNSCSGDELSSRNGLPNQSREQSEVECKDENERKSLTCPVKSTASPSVEDNLNCSQSERKPTSQMSAVGVDEENMEIDKVSNFETTDDVKPGSSMVNLDGKDEVKTEANKDLNETKGDKIELKSVNSELDGNDMKPIKSEADLKSKSTDEISADEKVNCLKSNKCNDDDTNNDKRDKNLTTGTDDCDTDDNVEVDLNLSKSDKLSTVNGAVNVDTNNAASPLSSISTLISAMDAAKQQQQVHLTREMKVESNESQTIPPVNGIKKANLNVKSNAVAATVNTTVNNSLNVSLNSNVTNTTSGRPSVIHKTPLKPCVKVVPTYKDNPIDGLPKDNSLLKKPCLPPIAHAATFLPSPWYTQQIPFTSGSSSTSSSVTKSTKLTANFTSSSLKRKVAPSSHQDSLLLPLDLTCKKRIVEVERKVVTPKDKVTSEDTSPSTILDLSAKVRVKECKSGKNSGLQVIHNSMDSNNNINNNTNNSIHRSAHQHAANNNAVINSVPKVPKSNNSNSNSNSNTNSNNSNSNNNVNINVNYERTTLKSNSSKAATNHQTQQQQQQQRHVNPSPLPVSSPVAITGTTPTPKHHSSSQSNHKTISNSNRSQLIKSSPSPNALKMKDKSNHSASSVTNSGSGLKDLNQQQQHLIQTHLNGLSNHQHHQHHQRRQQQQQQQQQQPLSSHHHQAQQQHQQLPLLPPGFPFSSSELSAANRDVQSKLQSSNTLNQLRAMVTPENFALASQTIAQEIAFREMERLHPNLAKQMSSAAAVLGYPAGFHPMLNSVHRPTVPSSPSISEYNPTLPSFLPFFNSFPTATAAGSGTQTNSNGNGSGPNMNMNAMAAAAAALASGHFFNPAMLGQQGGVSGFSPLELLGDERFSTAAAAAAENDARWRGWFE